METLRMSYTTDDIPVLVAEIERLKAENTSLRNEKADMEMMMEMASNHADEIGSDLLEKMDASIKEIEERVRIISETIPVPVMIVNIADGSILFANELSHQVFDFTAEDTVKYKAADLYQNPVDRQNFVNTMNQQGYVSDFHVRLKKKDGSLFWGALFSRSLDFKNEPCVLTVIYDLTERMQAEEQIRRLSEELSQREEKYLMFSLAGQDFGVHLLKIKEIIGLIPITPLTNTPDHIKGVANIRGKMTLVMDLRLRFRMKAVDYTDRTGIIVIEGEAGKKDAGMVVDAVTEILSIKGKDIEPPPPFGAGIDLCFIAGMAKIGAGVKILLNVNNLL